MGASTQSAPRKAPGKEETPAGLTGDPRHLSLMSSHLWEADLRLDASCYGEEARLAKLLLTSIPLPKKTIGGPGGLAEVWMPGRFKRIYTTEPNQGAPFLAASEILDVRPPKERFLSGGRTKAFASYFVSEGSILVTRSGTVGRSVYVSKRLAAFAISEDAIRIVPREDNLAGYIHAYIASFVGYNLVAKDQYGAVVQHIEPSHLEKVPIPLLPRDIQEEIHANVVKAYGMRDEANELLDQANQLVYGQCTLPELVFQDAPSLDPQRYVSAFATSRGKCASAPFELRLDARYYNPLADLAVQRIRALAPTLKIVTMGEVSRDVRCSTLRRRTFVAPEYGIPLLAGSNMNLVGAFETKHVSRSLTRNVPQESIQRFETIISCAGTVGTISFVLGNYEGWVASQDIIRVIPNELQVDPGYVYAFLAGRYGEIQLLRYVAGGTIPRIYEQHVASLVLPVPTDGGKEIGEKVRRAYELRAEAAELEHKAIGLLEATLLRAYEERTSHRLAMAHPGKVPA